jgi:hypothetical protein
MLDHTSTQEAGQAARSANVPRSLDNGTKANSLAYANPSEHLHECLAKLDLLLLSAMAQRTTRSATDYLSFAAITPSEIEGLLSPHRSADIAPGHDEDLLLLEQRIEARSAATEAVGMHLPLRDLARIFGLSRIECDVLLAALAPELDRKYERVYGYMHDDMSRKLPSIGLLMALSRAKDLTQRASVFDRQTPLLRYQLLHLTEDAGIQPFAARGLRLDERIVSYLLGVNFIDAGIAESLTPAPRASGPSLITAAHRAASAAIAAAIGAEMQRGGARRKLLVYLHGGVATTRDHVVRETAAATGLALLQVDAEQLAARSEGFAQSLFLLLRECLLGQAAAYIGSIDRLFEQDRSRLHQSVLTRWLVELGGVVFVSGDRPWSWGVPPEPIMLLPLELKPMLFVEQVKLWRSLTRDVGLSEAELHEVVSTHPMGPADIEATVRLAQALASLRTGETPMTSRDVRQACRTRSRVNLSSVAQRVEPKYRWEDIVLPAAALEQLRAICSQAKLRSRVLGEWGFERKLSLGKGLNALFAGPPGTGKTMAAEVVAADLDLDLYKIDLSQVVSKYIGETEKNLRQIFDGAAQAHAILLFDEADALLGKRSAVKDAHDRYANTEIAYLLQKMEEYEGITVLTTNLRQNMDEAFTRRMRFVVEFPFPDVAAREGIWRRAWPQATPMAADIDPVLLAQRFKLAGGSIRNITLTAAFLAAQHDAPVSMALVLESTRQELRKMGRLVDAFEDGSEMMAGATP